MTLDMVMVSAEIDLEAGGVKPISRHLFGIFFEDSNSSADGDLIVKRAVFEREQRTAALLIRKLVQPRRA